MFERLRIGLAKALVGSDFGSFIEVISSERGRGARRGTAELLASYSVSPWLRAVVGKIAMRVATQRWRVFRPVREDGTTRDVPSLRRAGPYARRKMLAQMKRDQQVIELEHHPLLDFLEGGNPLMTGLNARRLTQSYLDLPGEAFWVIERNRADVPAEFWALPPSWIVQVPDASDLTARLGGRSRDEALEGLSFRVQMLNAQTIDIPARDVVWFRDPNLSNPFGRGSGIGLALGDELEIDEFSAKFLKGFFLNDGRPDILIGVEGASEPELTRAKERYHEEHRGFWRGHRALWHGGKLTVRELQQKFVEMELAALRTMSRDTVLQVFGMPPEIMGIVENSNRATITAAELILATNVVDPRLEFQRAEIQAKVVPMFDPRLILDYESSVADDKTFELEAKKAAPHTVTARE